MDAQRRLYRLKPEPLQEVDVWLAPSVLAAISFGLAVAVSGLLLVLPTYSGWSSESPYVQQHATLLQVNGPRALIAVAIPVLIAL